MLKKSWLKKSAAAMHPDSELAYLRSHMAAQMVQRAWCDVSA
jgi:hypothetical protein